jgi:predicted ATPase/class 3 adenylate cyclase
VTFLFTDVENSTVLWEEHPTAMRSALARHDEILRTSILAAGGYVFSTGGDAFCASFSRAVDALAAAVGAQELLASQSWPEPVVVRVRIGLYTGEADERDGDYFGPAVNRAARVMAVARGGEVVCGETTAQILRGHLPDDFHFVPLGQRHLKGLTDPERLFGLVGRGLSFDMTSTSDALVEAKLPRALTRLIGRDAEAPEIAALLRAAWLVTLTGPGGVGKTSLALAVAGSVAGEYPDGVWWLELASVRDGGDVIRAVAGVIGVGEHSGQRLLDTVCQAIGKRRVLLVLDNCEHIAAAVAALVTDLGKYCAGVSVFATSRGRLGVPGERLVGVRPLAAEVITDPAMELLVERIDRPDLAQDPVERLAMLEICRQLDGLPLALELAAARCVALRPTEVATRLRSRLGLLADGHRSEERHQTLRGTLQWSYELLDERERLVFERLGVFVGGFSLEAAEFVCRSDDLDQLTIDDAVVSLIEKSLVEHDGRRYRLLETAREFALDKFGSRGGVNGVQANHLEFFVAFVRQARLGLHSKDEAIWLERLDADWANVRAAFRNALDGDDVDATTTIVAHLTQEGHWRRPECYAWSREAVERFGGIDFPRRHELLGAAAVAEWALGDLDRSLELGRVAMAVDPAPGTATDLLPEIGVIRSLAWGGRTDEAVTVCEHMLAVASTAGDAWQELLGRSYLGVVLNFNGRVVEAEEAAAEALPVAVRTGSPSGRAWAMFTLALTMRDKAAAIVVLEEGVTLAQSVRNDLIESAALSELYHLRAGHGDPAAVFPDIVRLAVDLQHRGRFLQAWQAVITAADVCSKLGHSDTAVLLVEACRASHAGSLGIVESLEAISGTLDADRVADLAAEGTRLTLADAIQLLVETSP